MNELLSTSPWQLGVALLLDLVFGDPRWLPHPARWTGALVAPVEKIVEKLFGRTVFAGGLFWIAVCVGQGLLLFVLVKMLPSQVWWVLETWLIYQCFAAMDMHRHVRAILRPLQAGELSQARAKLSWIVGRDTADLSESEVCRATVESVGESACDALIAPLFWAAVAGPLGAVIYRAANTLDSMVGHRGERYGQFGKCSARIDDLLNWIPARLVALLSQPLRIVTIAREARHHRSPNAGWGEAAVAWATGTQLGGSNQYEGAELKGPVFHGQGRTPDLASIRLALWWWWRMVIAGFTVMIALCYLR